MPVDFDAGLIFLNRPGRTKPKSDGQW